MNNKIKNAILLVCLSFISITSMAQDDDDVIRCWTDEYNAGLSDKPANIQKFIEIAQKVKDNPYQERAFINCDGTNTITIPVAVHFAGEVTCADAACLLAATEAQIQVLNEDFAATNADISVYNNLTAVCPGDYPASTLASNGTCLNFCLATSEHPASSGLEEGDPAITVGQHTWPSAGADWSGYLNIFVSDEAAAGLGTGVLGVSPLVGSANGDGFYVLPSSFGGPGVSCTSGTGINTSPTYNGGRTATHELGHYLGLEHVFAGGTCGADGDAGAVVPGAPTVNDTSPQDAPNFGCPANVTSCATAPTHCGSPDMFTSFMDYGDDACLVMFTEDQAQVMNYIANQVIPFDTDGSKCAEVSNNTVDACGVSCPTVTPMNDVGSACASAIGTLVTDWQASLGADFMDPDGSNGPNAGLQYSSVPITDATFPQTAPTGTYAGDGCGNDVQTWYAYYECDDNSDGTAESYIDAGNYALTIFADAQAPTIVADDLVCNYSVMFACAGDSEGSTTVDGSTEAPGYAGNPTESVEVVTANGCTATFMVAKAACSSTGSLNCPTVTAVNTSGSACASEIGTFVTDWQASLGADFMDADGANGPNAGLQYSSVAIGDATFPQAAPTGVYAGDGCTSEVQTWYAYYECDNNSDGTADSFVDAGNCALTIYADAQAPTIVADDAVCNYSVMFACAGDSEGTTTVDGSVEDSGYAGNPSESVEVVTMDGCTQTFMVSKPACDCNCDAEGGQF